MITPPPNPNSDAARTAMLQHNARVNPVEPVEPHHGETVIMEWHQDGDRTFVIDEVKRWFKIAMPLMKATHDAPGGNDERIR